MRAVTRKAPYGPPPYGPLRQQVRRNALRAEAKEDRKRAEQIVLTLPRVPAIGPIPNSVPEKYQERGERWYETEVGACECGRSARPKHRAMRFPVLGNLPPMLLMRPELVAEWMQTVEFQAMQYGLDVRGPNGGMRFHWWGWEPTESAHKPEVWRGLGRAAAMCERIKQTLEWWLPQLKELQERGGGYYNALPPYAQLHEWCRIAIEDVEQTMGRP
jgi:hypothetical protein